MCICVCVNVCVQANRRHCAFISPYRWLLARLEDKRLQLRAAFELGVASGQIKEEVVLGIRLLPGQQCNAQLEIVMDLRSKTTME